MRFFIKFFENQPMYRKIGHCLKFSFFLFVADKNPRFLSGFFVWSCLIILRILQSVYFFLLLFNCLTTWPRLTSHREKSNKIRDTGISSLLFDQAKNQSTKLNIWIFATHAVWEIIEKSWYVETLFILMKFRRNVFR